MNEESSNPTNKVEDMQHRSSRSDNRLFPISTYIENSTNQSISASTSSLASPESKIMNIQQWQSVADRISELELENQQQVNHDHNKQSYTYLDPSKTNRVPNSTLKAFQKNAVQSYFERQQQQQQSLRLSKTRVSAENDDQIKLRKNDPRSLNHKEVRSSFNASQRASLPNCPSEVSSMIGVKSNNNMMKDRTNEAAKKNVLNNSLSSSTSESHLNQINDGKQAVNLIFTSFCEIKTENCNMASPITEDSLNNRNSDINKDANSEADIKPPPLPRKSCIVRRTSSASEYSSNRDKILNQNQHLSKDLLAPMILGKIISIDDWVPERPPKPMNRSFNGLALRIPSPDLPPPPIEATFPPNELDETLPLPPLEVLKQNYEMKVNYPPSRRNSFAGQGSLSPKVIKNINAHLSPPAVPMRPKIIPTPIMTLNSKPVTYQLPNVQKQQVFNEKQCLTEQATFNHHKQQDFTPPRVTSSRSSDQRISIRKRAHNSLAKDCIGYTQTPPPLKPRMHNQNERSVQIQPNFVNDKVRSSSKSPYSPHQQREKSFGPDHGSYKLTLHELNDNLNVKYQENLAPCNLPDVLPINVKYHNLYRNTQLHHHHARSPNFYSSDYELATQSAPTIKANQMESIFNFQSSNSPANEPSSAPIILSSATAQSPNTEPVTSSVSFLGSSMQSPKYTSQSTIDLKMTQVIDPKLSTDEESIKNYHQQKEAYQECDKSILCDSLKTIQSLNECDNKIAVVRKLNMVESCEAITENLNDTKTTGSTENLQEKAMNEKSEKQIKIENSRNNEHLQELSPTKSIDDPVPIQKSEIILKVQDAAENKIDMACQTDDIHESDESFSSVSSDNDRSNKNPFISLVKPKRSSEEFDLEKLSKDLISQLSPSDKLHNILVPKTIKSSADYVSDLFKINATIRPTKKDVSTSTLEKSAIKSSMELLTSNSTYFSTSEPKAKLMTRYSREMTLINNDSSDLIKKKEELVERLGKKLKILEAEQTILAEESSINDSLGHDLAFKVAQKIKPGDSSKFRSYVDDIGYVTMLLLSLSGRLARIDNALHTIGEKTTDKIILENKRDKLLEQLDEAKCLKEDIDRRGLNLSKILEKSLTQEEFADYDYFINMKAKLIVDSREIAEKIKLGEEQLNALKDTLVHSEC